MKNDMKETDYYKSGDHCNNLALARINAALRCKELKQERIRLYNLNPTKCLFCDTSFEYDNRKKKFCDKTCSAKYNNARRTVANDTKIKISNSLKTTNKKQKESGIKPVKGKQFCNLYYKSCIICNDDFIVSSSRKDRKCCSSDCFDVFKSQIRMVFGKKKTYKVFNIIQNKNVNFDSSWEYKIYEYLNQNNIKWIRPEPILWNDIDKEKKYFPDFYLIDYNIYLDPKNDFVIMKDKEKLDFITKKIYLIYGHYLDIIKKLDGLFEIQSS